MKLAKTKYQDIQDHTRSEGGTERKTLGRQGERGSPGLLELRCSPKERGKRWGHYWKMAKMQGTK